MARTEGNLFSLSKKVIWIAIQNHLANHLQRDQFLGNNFCGIEHIKLKTVCHPFVEDLEPQLIFRKVASGNRIPQISPMKVRVSTVNLHRLLPQHRNSAEFWTPVKLHEFGFTGLI